jgi:hypothetical protein
MKKEDKKIGKCQFCEEVIIPLLKAKKKPFDVCPEAYQTYLEHVKVRNAVGYCRGFKLCERHLDILKQDNHKRWKLGEEIPQSLELLSPISNNVICKMKK